jgi:hypothetical protein
MKILLEELSEKQILPTAVNWIRVNNPKFLTNIAILLPKGQNRVFKVCDHSLSLLDKIKNHEVILICSTKTFDILLSKNMTIENKEDQFLLQSVFFINLPDHINLDYPDITLMYDVASNTIVSARLLYW